VCSQSSIRLTPPSLPPSLPPLPQLGQGAFGLVFLCIHRKTKQKCAVKVVNTSRLNLDDARHMEDEIDILKVRPPSLPPSLPACVCVRSQGGLYLLVPPSLPLSLEAEPRRCPAYGR